MIIGLSRTGLTFARPLWSLCSIWLKSVICNPIKPIYDEYNQAPRYLARIDLNHKFSVSFAPSVVNRDPDPTTEAQRNRD